MPPHPILSGSHGAEALYGFTAEEAVGQASLELLQTQLPEPLELILTHLRSGRPWHGDLTQTRKGGSLVFVTSHWIPGSDPHSRTPTTIEIDTDITEHKRAEAAQNRLAAIIESSEDAIISKSLDGTITSWNAAAERLFGYRADEVLGAPISLITPANRQAEAAIVQERLRAGEHVEPFETVRRTKDGRLIDVALTLSPVRDAAGHLIGVSKIVRDISRQKRAEESDRLARETAHRWQVEQREQILSAMMEHIPLGLTIADVPDPRIRMVSRYGRRLLQKPREQIVGTAASQHPGTFEFLHPDSAFRRGSAAVSCLCPLAFQLWLGFRG